jgi:hypothetical protein
MVAVLERNPLDLTSKLARKKLILISTSGSMSILVGLRRLIDKLVDVLGQCPIAEYSVANFSDNARVVHSIDYLPEPVGGNRLDLGLRLAQDMGFSRILLVTDRLPDFPDLVQTDIHQRLDVFYIGIQYERATTFFSDLKNGKFIMGDLPAPDQEWKEQICELLGTEK